MYCEAFAGAGARLTQRTTPLSNVPISINPHQTTQGANSAPSVSLPVHGGGAGPDAQQPPVRPAPGHHAWFHHPQKKDSKATLPSVAGITAPAAAPHVPAPLAAAGGSSSEAHQPGAHGNQGQAHQSLSHRFAFVNMQSFWQSLKTWQSFKHYLRGLRDLVLIAKPVEHFLLRTGVRARVDGDWYRGRCAGQPINQYNPLHRLVWFMNPYRRSTTET